MGEKMVKYKKIFKKTSMVLIDIAIIFGIYLLTGHSFGLLNQGYTNTLLIIVGVKFITFILMRLYNFLFSQIGIVEFFKIFLSIVISSLILFGFFELSSFDNLKWELFFYAAPLEILFLSAVRFYRRILRRFRFSNYFNGHHDNNTLIVGAGSAGKYMFDTIMREQAKTNRVVAYIDDSPEKQDNSLNGVPILGPISKVAEYIDRFSVNEVIIAIADIDRIRLSEIIEFIAVRSVKIKRLPLLIEEPYDTRRKIVDVDIKDLLNRSVVTFDNYEINEFINNKVVLVTGGGGSIGSELCKQILAYNPKELIIFDIYENTTYETQVDLLKTIHNQDINTELTVLIGSVYNYNRIKEVFEKYKPELVFHAAAYKHVPLMEDSAVEAVRTNVLGTYNVASLANEYQTNKMILVSSDKAVRPTNVMGATKAICEQIIQYFDTISVTSYAAVRFGNVLGSHGSVVPLFSKQIEEGGPVTITHPEITRFFMMIPEAVNLILQSAVYATGGEIFILDMGEPVKIVDLADKMIRLSGLIPNHDIKIEYVGLRPGEKLYEELLLDVTNNIRTENNKIYVETKREISDIEAFITLVRKTLDNADNQAIKELVHSMVNSYNIDNNHKSK
jgi:FlaA1/EpsC-like NDP-sugar epimerase